MVFKKDSEGESFTCLYIHAL